MNYLLTILEPPGQRAERTPEQGRDAYAAMLAFAEELKGAGTLRAVESLSDAKNGARVQVRGGQQRVVDGPFAEAKEMIGGFFLVDCASMDEAVALAARCPAAIFATVEVRPVGPCWS